MFQRTCQECGCESSKDNEVRQDICDHCYVTERNTLRQQENKTMPNMRINAIFYARLGWIQFEYEGGTKSEFINFQGSEIIRVADMLSTAEWLTLQDAIKNADLWRTVDVNVINLA